MHKRREKDIQTSGESKVRAKRIGMQRELIVQSRTIGTPIDFPLATENMSRTGLLLAAPGGCRIPYQVHTLLELYIDVTGRYFDAPVSCLGKVVRIVEKGERRDLLGVQIIQMDSKDSLVWDRAMGHLESQDKAEHPTLILDAAKI